MKKRLWMAALIFAIALAGLACPLANAQEKVIKLDLATFWSKEHPITRLMNEWCMEVAKRTNGRVKVTQFPGGTLVPSAQTFTSVIAGVADMGISFNAYTRGRLPLSDLLTEPLGCKDGYQGSMLANAFYKKFKPKEFDQVKVCFLTNAPPQAIAAKKPIRTMEDLKGLRTRAAGGVETSVLQALGTVPVALPMPDVYDALQKGVIDAFMGSTEALKAWKLGEVATSLTYFDARPNGAGYFIMNKDKWNAIPPDARKRIDEINDEYAEKLARLWNVIAKDGENFFIQKGGKVYVLPKAENGRWTKKVHPVVDAYVRELKSKGLPGDEALKFCMDYLRTH